MAIRLDTLEKLGLPASSKKILSLIRERRFSYGDLAELAGISADEIDDILRKPDEVKLTVWEKVCGVFGLTPEQLVEMKEPRQ